MYVARLDGLISSFLGSTSKNIRALFDFAAKTPCVLFLDEFDAIAKLRGDSQELGELKRVVNSFIQNLDTLGSQSIVIAATNHQELLDSAIWRRFSYRLALDFPAADLREKMWTAFQWRICNSRRARSRCSSICRKGFPARTFMKSACGSIAGGSRSNSTPALKDAFQVLQNMGIGEGEDRRFLSLLRGKDEQAISALLRERNAKLYSHAALADLFGVSKATAHRWAKGGKEQMAETPRPPRQERLLIKVIMPKQGTERKVPGGGTPPKPFRPVDAEIPRVACRARSRRSARRSFRRSGRLARRPCG